MPTLVYASVSVSQRHQKCTLDVAQWMCTGPPSTITVFSYEP